MNFKCRGFWRDYSKDFCIQLYHFLLSDISHLVSVRSFFFLTWISKIEDRNSMGNRKPKKNPKFQSSSLNPPAFPDAHWFNRAFGRATNFWCPKLDCPEQNSWNLIIIFYHHHKRNIQLQHFFRCCLSIRPNQECHWYNYFMQPTLNIDFR